jgi:type I restriction-modification system DNA methylase subunit
MDVTFRREMIKFLREQSILNQVISEIEFDTDAAQGFIEYQRTAVKIASSTPGFVGQKAKITDEELVRAYLIVRLVAELGYEANSKIIEFEKSYKSVGRDGKGGRTDITVYNRDTNDVFLFIECKEPNKYDADIRFLDGQLFRLSKQERNRPTNLVYYTVEYNSGELKERLILINTKKFAEFEDWDKAGQPIIDSIPKNYGIAEKRKYAKVEFESDAQRALDYSVDSITFNRIRHEIHDVIWGGGGTNNNDVFIYITKLILCKIFDELETLPNSDYEFQRYGDSETPEAPSDLVKRMNVLYKKAEQAYLALPKPSSGPAFDHVKVSDSKIAYVIGRLEGISVTRNVHNGDLLGEFFEQIVSQDFTQSKGQFFTPPKVIRFINSLVDVVGHADNILRTKKDYLGRHRLPYVIDPSCGSGTFLIEYMKVITKELGDEKYSKNLSDRIKEIHGIWFGGQKKTNWAKDFLFGIENNYDLGLSAKVNMVLHGDGSMNTWINNGLLPFHHYWADGRNNILGTKKEEQIDGYKAPLNEQFDLILSNPPFSLTSSPDEKNDIKKAFGDNLKISEQLFIERWFQLLRPGGLFCSVLPENILDTSTNKSTRKFLMSYFKIMAVVSLPYDAFKPFTSTKTSIVLAEKKSHEEIKNWNAIYERYLKETRDEDLAFHATLKELGLDNQEIFMAEPAQIGYKRRKNLPDLQKVNQLYNEDSDGFVSEIDLDNPTTVLDFYFTKKSVQHSELGFKVTLGEIVSRQSFRIDPKYCWLWYKQFGEIGDPGTPKKKLSSYLRQVRLPKVPKGALNDETELVDLDNVMSRSGRIYESQTVLEIGSDRVLFDGAEYIYSKLEPYLGKLIIDPPNKAIGSPEWIGFKRISNNVPKIYLGYLLMHPSLCEAYRRLQSGKRHARLDPQELLELLIPSIDIDAVNTANAQIEQEISAIRIREQEIKNLRFSIDSVFKV